MAKVKNVTEFWIRAGHYTKGFDYISWIKHASGAHWHCMYLKAVKGSDVVFNVDVNIYLICHILDLQATIVLDCQRHLNTRI